MANFPYLYCPVCAAKLAERHLHGKLRPACPACSFVRFQDPKVSVIAAVTVSDRILMTRRAVDPQKGKWSLPGGYMDAGEMPIAALKRELIEEVGLEIEVGELLEIYPLKAEIANAVRVADDGLAESKKAVAEETVGIVLAFAAWPVSQKLEVLESNDDVSEAAWLTWPDVPLDNLAFESTYLLLQQWHLKNN